MSTQQALPGMTGVIRLRRFMGKSGGFGSQYFPRWTAEIVGINGAIEPCDPDLPWGHSMKQYAQQEAQRWRDLLGWEIVEVDEVTREDLMTVPHHLRNN